MTRQEESEGLKPMPEVVTEKLKRIPNGDRDLVAHINAAALLAVITRSILNRADRDKLRALFPGIRDHFQENLIITGHLDCLVKRFDKEDAEEEAAAKLAAETSADKTTDTATEDDRILKCVLECIEDIEASRLIDDPEIAEMCQKLRDKHFSPAAETSPVPVPKPPFIGPDLTDTSGLSDAP